MSLLPWPAGKRRTRDNKEPIPVRRCIHTRMKPLCKIILPAVLIALFSSVAYAQGIIIVEPPRPLPPRFVPVLHILDHHVSVSVDNQVARTRIQQIFRNDCHVILEGTYVFPIPAGASITEFSMWMNGQKVTGEVLDARDARRIYEDIVRRLRDPGLLEYVGQDLFRARVFPVPAHGDVKMEVVYQELLKLDSGLVGYRYPLSPRHTGRGVWGDFSFEMSIESAAPIKTVYSPNYDIERRIKGREAHCSFEEHGFRPGSDFLVYYMVSEEDIGANLLTYRRRNDAGHFMLLLSPGDIGRDRKALSKDVIFVIDRSGSMRGEKIEQAKEALRYCLESLDEGDRFRLVTFATDVREFQTGLSDATRRSIRDALEFVDDIRARGGTDIDAALTAALDLPSTRRPQFVIFLTDGEPTVGETDIYKIIENAGEHNRQRTRLFVFGVGYDVNTRLLDRLSLDNRGTVEYVKPEEDIEVKVSNFYAKVSHPVLSDPAVEISGADVYDIFPAELPDLFSGSQLAVVGRYEGSGPATIRLSGHVGEREEQFVYESRFAKRNRHNSFLGPIWAGRKIAYLIEEIRTHGENRELVDEVIELATDYGIVTPYTSYLILEDDRPGRLPGVVREWAESSVGDVDEVRSAFETVRGAPSFSMSKKLSDAKREEVVSRSPGQSIVYLGGKTFYQTADGWIDADFKDDMPTVDIVFLSNEYFELIDEQPELARYLSVGENLILVYQGTAYKITA